MVKNGISFSNSLSFLVKSPKLWQTITRLQLLHLSWNTHQWLWNLTRIQNILLRALKNKFLKSRTKYGECQNIEIFGFFRNFVKYNESFISCPIWQIFKSLTQMSQKRKSHHRCTQKNPKIHWLGMVHGPYHSVT